VRAAGRALGEERSAGIPADLLCPLSRRVLVDPVVAADGYTYERKDAEAWLRTSQLSPVTKLPLSDTNLIPNRLLKQLLAKY
jgi:hypothetical protein